MIERAKTHIKEHLVEYTIAVVGLTAGITVLVMRSAASKDISRAIGVTAGRDIVVARKNLVMNSVSFISAERQGPPSWVVRCKETGNIFTSQRAAALAMDLSEQHISSHLNGSRDHVDGFNFERICMAA